MLSPRHRYNRAAPALKLPSAPDGLKFKPMQDELTKQFVAVMTPAAKGAKKVQLRGTDDLMLKAYDVFSNIAMRSVWDSILFATLDYAAAASILKDDIALVKVYADVFFDIQVFADNPTFRIAYIDAVFNIDPKYAEILRNLMSMSYEDLMFLSDKSSANIVEPKHALEAGLKLHFNLMQVLMQVRVETFVLRDNKEEFDRFVKLHSMASTSSALAHKFAETILKYDLAANKQNFLQEFALRLDTKRPEDILLEPGSVEVF